MQEVIIYVFLLALFEFYESSWQRGATFKEIVANIYAKYRQGLFVFFFAHPSFIYALYLGIKFDLTNFWFMSLLFMKFLDISYKLVLVKKIEENSLHEAVPIPLETPVPLWMSYLNVFLYPLLLFLAFANS